MIHEIIRYDGSKVEVDQEALLLPGVKEIKEATKEEWTQWVLYAFLMESPHRSNVYYNIPKDQRGKYVLKAIFGTETKEEPKGVNELRKFIKQYYEELSVDIWAYNKMYNALIKAIDFLQKMDLSDRTKSGLPVYKPADVFAAIDRAKKALVSLQEAREKVWSTMYGGSKARGGKEINPFET